jgi:hypothetical protein
VTEAYKSGVWFLALVVAVLIGVQVALTAKVEKVRQAYGLIASEALVLQNTVDAMFVLNCGACHTGPDVQEKIRRAVRAGKAGVRCPHIFELAQTHQKKGQANPVCGRCHQ